MKPTFTTQYPCVLATVTTLAFSSAGVASPLDTDHNHLDDVWEILHAGALGILDADADPDADGFHNKAESDAGTDPLDPASSFTITSTASTTTNDITLTWPSVAGKAYLLSTSDDLTQSSWRDSALPFQGHGSALSAKLSTDTDSALLGALVREVWLDLRGEKILDLTTSPGFPDTPSGIHAVSSFACPVDDGENFGVRLRGYLVPQVSGSYTFGLASRHDSQFYFSRTTNPDDKQLLLSYPDGGVVIHPAPVGAANVDAIDVVALRTDARYDLVAGQAYYVELLHKAGTGSNHCSVTWQHERMQTPEVVPGDQLAAWLGRPEVPLGGPRRFYRLGVGNLDTDEDGASDWQELAVGYHRFDPDSANAGILDGESLTRILRTETNHVTLSAPVNAAYESGTNGSPVPARLTFTRNGNLAPLTVKFTLAGTARPGDDYTAPSGLLTFPFATDEVTVEIPPVADNHYEIPETLSAELVRSSDYEIADTATATLTFEDDQTYTETLFVAQLGPQGSAVTPASGISTLFLSGDRLQCRITTDFSNLTSEETAAHIHLVDNGDILHGLPLGVFVDDIYVFPESGASVMTSNQEVLDALTSGRFYINVHTTNYPHGEIRGDYIEAQGSIAFDPPPPPPNLPPYTGAERTRDLLRFLNQATFGATSADLAALEASTIDDWITGQLDPVTIPHSTLLAYTYAADTWEYRHNEALGEAGDPAYNPQFEPNHHNRRRAWWMAAVNAPDQLRQRVAFALSELFVTSEENSRLRSRHHALAHYYDTLAAGAFGNFRDLLEDVTLHPVMGYYLSMVQNAKADLVAGTSPDENYAREIMQLFSIGLLELHPDGTVKLDPVTALPLPTYSNNDITELARVFTGWSYAVQQQAGPGTPPWENSTVTENNSFYYGGGAKYLQAAYHTPMKMFPQFHDTGAKTIVGNTPVAAGQSGEQDLADALDTLFEHPNTGPFVCRRLIQRLVTSNPSRGYVYRVAAVFEDDGNGVRGNLGAVVRALLTDYEARALDLADDIGYGKQREPVVRFAHVLRAFGGHSDLPLTDFASVGYTHNYPAGTSRLRMPQTDNQLTQTPQAAPSVFNWFLPDYVVPGSIASAGLVAPEFQTTAETSVVTSTNYVYGIVFGSNGVYGQPVPGLDPLAARIKIDLAPLETLLTNGGETALIDHLNKILCANALSAEATSTITTAVTNSSSTSKVKTALYLVLNSPEFIIQK